MAGFGGQGILMIGDILAQAAMIEGFNSSWLPSYGVEMRGGRANCTVVISSEKIGSPVIGFPVSLIIMDSIAMDKYQEKLKTNGLLILNTSLVSTDCIIRNNIEIINAPTSELALEVGSLRTASMIALGIFVAKTGVVKFDSLFSALQLILPTNRAELLKINKKALLRGREFVNSK